MQAKNYVTKKTFACYEYVSFALVPRILCTNVTKIKMRDNHWIDMKMQLQTMKTIVCSKVYTKHASENE